MTLRERVLLAAAVLFLALAGGVGYEWLQEHDARAKAEATAQAQQAVIAAAQKQIDDAQKDSAATAARLQQQMATLEGQKQQPATALDVAALLNSVLKPAQPVVVAPAPASAAGLPNAPAVAIPDADLKSLRDYALTCQETAAQSDACTQQLADAQTATKATQQQLAATAQQRDAWKKAANGGGFWTKIGRDVKCLAIEGGATAGGAALDHQMPARGAAIGLLAGGVGCRLF